MTALDRLIPAPRLDEVDAVDLDAPADVVWQRIRCGPLAVTPIARTLFAVRTWLDRGGDTAPAWVSLDRMTSSPAQPGFQVLADDPPREVAVGAIGQVWRLRIPFVHVPDADAFRAFDAPGYVKVAWAMRVAPRASGSRLELEVRVTATDAASWRRFRRYFLVIGPASRFIRRGLLRALARESSRAAAA